MAAKSKLILVTGGAGYIGRVLVNKLLFYGHRVRVVDRFFFPVKEAFDERVELIAGDITNPHNEWFKDVDGVCHLAGFSNDPTADADPERNEQVNRVGTSLIGKYAEANGVERLTYASSASIYDLPGAKYTNQATEERAVTPVGYYSVTKYQGEQALPGNAVIFRQATVFGDSPRMRFDLVVNTMMRSALSSGEILVHGGGHNHRPLISVDNVAMAHVHAMLNRHPREPGVYNLVDYNMSVRQIAEEVREGVALALPGDRVRIVDAPYPEGTRIRDYRISGAKYDRLGSDVLSTSLRYTVQSMAAKWVDQDMFKPEYENLSWMRLVG